jgi:hypothetical protein
MKKDKTELLEDWKLRLLEERANLLNNTIKLKNAIDSPDMKLTCKEWDMLREQYHAMREYLQVLTDRCVYYGLIEHGDLGLHY